MSCFVISYSLPALQNLKQYTAYCFPSVTPNKVNFISPIYYLQNECSTFRSTITLKGIWIPLPLFFHFFSCPRTEGTYKSDLIDSQLCLLERIQSLIQLLGFERKKISNTTSLFKFLNSWEIRQKSKWNGRLNKALNPDEAHIEGIGIHTFIDSKTHIISHFTLSKIDVHAYTLLFYNYCS